MFVTRQGIARDESVTIEIVPIMNNLVSSVKELKSKTVCDRGTLKSFSFRMAVVHLFTLETMGMVDERKVYEKEKYILRYLPWSRRKWQPTPVFLPGEPQGLRSLVGCRLWGRTESDTTEATWQQQQQDNRSPSKV